MSIIEKYSLENKVIVVTGGTGILGNAFIDAIVEAGGTVGILGRKKEVAEERANTINAKGGKAIALVADVLNEAQLQVCKQQVLNAFGKIDGLVNNAYPRTNDWGVKFEDIPLTSWKENIDWQLNSYFYMTQQVAAYMKGNKKGSIVNIGSIVGNIGFNELVGYGSAKAALIGFTKSLAFELAPKGIIINMVTPSLVSTELTADITEKFKMLTASQTPLRRLAKASDVAGAISFLASEKANFLAGENIRINGGQIML
mgnify:CR=1 FL=1